MNKLRQIHTYLGCIFAPMLILFAVSGSWQLFGLHHSTKDGYRPPKPVAVLSQIHNHQHLPPTNSKDSTPLRYFMLAAAIGLVATTVLGIVMAFRFNRRKAPVIICLAAGVAIPVVVLLIYR